MPSGAKKRKAAKKRKENKPNNNQPNPSPASSTHSHGDDVKHCDDQESEAGEIREIKVEDEFKNKNGKIEINEANRKSYNGGSSESSSDGSSDDESRVLKNRSTVSNNAPVLDSTRAVDSLSETFKDVHSSVNEAFDMGSSIDKSVSSYETNSVFNKNGAKSIEDKIGNSAALKAAALERNVDGTGIQSVKNTAVILEPKEHLLPDKEICVKKSVSSYETNSVLNKNGAKSIEDKIGNSAALKAAALERNVDGTGIQSVKNTAVILEPKEHLLPDKDDNSALLYNGVEHVKDSEITEPLLNPSLQPVEQKTSWKSCCGLFEVFTGSGR